MKKKSLVLWLFAAILCIFPAMSIAGDLDSPSGPDDAASAMYTIEDVYQRLDTGAEGAKRTGAFTEPTAGPGSTGHTTDDIMDAAPAVDDTNGAATADVAPGKTFWGLNSSTWGPRIGTMPDSTGDITPTAINQPIPAGYHDGTGNVLGDVDLITGNIVNGVEIFGVTGSASGASGNALIDQVLAGQTFSNSVNSGLTGTMPNIGAQNITPGTSAQTITAGYHDGTGEVAGDADLVSGKIVNGSEIFGVTGTAKVATGSATDAQVRDGVSYSNSGGAATGSMPLRTLSPDNNTVNAGYYGATTLSTVDTDLATGNIRSGVTVFGVAGDANVVNTSSGDAVASNITSGKKAWVDGSELTGTAVFTAGSGIPKTGQTTSYATGDDGDLEKGATWPSPRFTDNGDGTVTDNLTGLIWLKNANAGGSRTWANALAYCNALAAPAAGLTDSSVASDWRLPNVKELQSLFDFGQYGPALPSGHPFTNVQSGYYWSGTTYALNTGYAWSVPMSTGDVSYTDKTSSNYVWPVRGGND